jgi:hypothetical protein
MHSIAIFLGFLTGSYGLAWCCLIALALWVSRGYASANAELCPPWARPTLAIITLPVPLLLLVGGWAALWWGVRG